jgi:hypothetical protein
MVKNVKWVLPMMFICGLSLAGLLSCDEEQDVEEKEMAYDFSEDVAAVVNRVMTVTRVADSLFDVCQTAVELRRHTDELKSVDGLEYVEFNSQGMALKVKNFLPISYIYPDYGETETASTARVVEERAARAMHTLQELTEDSTRALENKGAHIGNNLQTFCIVDQLSHDEGFSYVPQIINNLEENAKKLGIEVTVLRNTVDPQFFRNQMYDYDMLFILAHGGYTSFTGAHCIATSWDYGTNLSAEEIESLFKSIRDNEGNGLDPRYFELGNIQERHTRNGRLVKEKHCYLAVTDKYISDGPYAYPEGRNGKAIVFSASCMALKGNSKMADAFLNKGAVAYIGYDETQTVGVKGGQSFFMAMLSGNTLSQAFSDIPSALRVEHRSRTDSLTGVIYKWTATLKTAYNKGLKNVENFCARCVVTHDADIVDFESSEPNIWGEEQQGITILTGSARLLYADSYVYGFFIGQEKDMSDAQKLVELSYDRLGKNDARLTYDKQKDEMTFHYVFEDGDLQGNKTYYFCAYLRDNNGHYCYGEVKPLKPDAVYGELGLFELRGPVKSCTFRRGSAEPVVRTFDRDGFWLTYNGQPITSIYDMGITRDQQGRITEGRFEGGFESYEYDARGRILKYGYLLYDGGYGATYKYDDKGLLWEYTDEPWGMDAEYYGTDVYHYKDYTIDRHGNWTRRLAYTDFSGHTENRTIEYYEDITAGTAGGR